MNEQEKMMVVERGVAAGKSGVEMLAEIEADAEPEEVEETTAEPTEIEETVEATETVEEETEPEDEAEAES